MKKIAKNKRLTVIIPIICIIVIIGIIIGANVIKVNIANGKYNSSNSGSNNKNLIPEYIKEGITLGGITGTLKVLDTSDATAKPEDITKGKTAYVNGVKITGTKITREILKIGDYVEYTPDTASAYSLTTAVSGYTSNQSIPQETMKWQIMSVNEDGTVDLISETSTSQKVYLFGDLGYNNGVWILNDICSKQYSNKSLGITARSIKIEDIESKFSDKGIQARNEYNHYGTNYGSTYKIINQNDRTYYPLLYSRENGSGIDTDTIKKDGIGRSESYYTTPTTETGTNATSLTATQTSYALNISTNNNYFINEEFYNLISKGEYTIASRGVRCYSNSQNDCIGFGLFRVVNDTKDFIKKIVSGDLSASYGSYGSTAFASWGLGLRPVTTLGANIEFTSGDGSIDNPYKISI